MISSCLENPPPLSPVLLVPLSLSFPRPLSLSLPRDESPYTPGAGKTLAENLADCPGLKPGQDVILPLETPLKATGHLEIMYGSLAPEGCVGKITGKEGLIFQGPARVFDSEEDMLAALSADPQALKVQSPVAGTGNMLLLVCQQSLTYVLNGIIAVVLHWLLQQPLSQPVLVDLPSLPISQGVRL